MARRRRANRPGEPLDVDIESLSHEGRGIARVDGKTVFVFGALPGERVRIRVRRRARQFDEADVVEVLAAAPERVTPRCPVFGVCGGCSLQHVDGDRQVEIKQQSLLAQLAHAGVEVGEILPPLRAAAWGYRDKARLGVKYVAAKGRVLVGFRERQASYIADMRRCDVLLPRVGERLDALAALIGGLDARARIPQIEVAADRDRVQLVFRHLDPLSPGDRERLVEFAREHDFDVQLQPGGPDSLQNLYPDEQSLYLEPLADGSIRIPFRATDFVQVNRAINQQMVAQAIRLLELEPGERVLDLFCGLGNFTLPLARGCASVCGVEGDAAMVERARLAARLNGIDNAEFCRADLGAPDPAAAWSRQRWDKLLLDPPRSGAREIAADIGRYDARRIVYVSCQPSSLVRDAAIIRDQGYRLTHLGIMDMFPSTAHVESMAVFAR